jgi:hypothetical protein
VGTERMEKEKWGHDKKYGFMDSFAYVIYEES